MLKNASDFQRSVWQKVLKFSKKFVNFGFNVKKKKKQINVNQRNILVLLNFENFQKKLVKKSTKP